MNVINVITGFIIRPIRHNNSLMFNALNPRIAGHTIKVVLNETIKHKKA